MRLAQGDNHLISARDGLAICQVWTRPDLDAESGARNAREMVLFLIQHAIRQGSPYRGVIFDVRRGPAVFGPQTRETLGGLFTQAGKVGVPVAVLVTPTAPMQAVQFGNLCRSSAGRAEVFENESDAIRWFVTQATDPSGRPPR